MNKIVQFIVGCVLLIAFSSVGYADNGLLQSATEYLAAVEAGDVETFRKYELSDVDAVSAIKKMKTAYSDFQIEAVNATDGEGLVYVKAKAKMFGFELESVPLTQKWKLVDGGWKIVRESGKFGMGE